jgi:hypothetical protein
MVRLNRDDIVAGKNGAPVPAHLITSTRRVRPPITGKWNLTVMGPVGPHASWLEITSSGFTSFVGRFVDRIGGARPIGRVEWNSNEFRFAIPPQWDRVGGLAS